MNNYTPTAEPKALADGVPVFCSHDTVVDPVTLVPNVKNPNTHPDEQIQLLGRIIRQTGWRQPITVSTRSGFIVKGHGRLAAAILEGFKAVPVDYQNYASEAEEYADLVADNRLAELAEIDNKMLADIFADIDTGEIPIELTGYTEEEMESLITGLSEALHEDKGDPDEVPEIPAPENVITEKGDLWMLGSHRLLCGDSTNAEDVDALMDGAKADMVFTDPPYALFGNSTGVSNVGDDKMILPFFREIGKAIERNVKIMGHAYVCHDWQTSATIKDAFDLLAPKNLIVWRKAEAGGLGTYYTKIYELIWLFANEPERGILGKNKHAPARTINGVANIWDCPVVQAPQRDHNAQKPVNVVKIAVENSSDHGEKVLDLFGGSGTTMIACEEIGRDCYMMEMEPKYCDVIVKRYIKTTGKKDVRLFRNGEEMSREHFDGMLAE